MKLLKKVTKCAYTFGTDFSSEIEVTSRGTKELFPTIDHYEWNCRRVADKTTAHDSRTTDRPQNNIKLCNPIGHQ